MSESADARFQRLQHCIDTLAEQVAKASGQIVTLQCITTMLIVETLRHASDPVARVKTLAQIMQNAIEEKLKDCSSSVEITARTECMASILGEAQTIIEELSETHNRRE